jgi:hypothetical protein
MSPAHAIPRKSLFVIIPGAIVLFLLLCAAYILFWPQRIEDHIRKAVTDALAVGLRPYSVAACPEHADHHSPT